MVEDAEASRSQENPVKPIRGWKGYLWNIWELPSD